MKFNFTKYFTVLLLILAVCILHSAFFTPNCTAQPYYTNSMTAGGAAQPNDSLTNTAFTQYITRSQQRAVGIQAGTVATTTTLKTTNTFPYAIYTVAPIINANCNNTNITIGVSSVTTTNFILTTSATNQTIYWSAIGY